MEINYSWELHHWAFLTCKHLSPPNWNSFLPYVNFTLYLECVIFLFLTCIIKSWRRGFISKTTQHLHNITSYNACTYLLAKRSGVFKGESAMCDFYMLKRMIFIQKSGQEWENYFSKVKIRFRRHSLKWNIIRGR